MIEALQESVRVRDEFLSIASHELRTPLTALSLQQDSALRALHKLPSAEGGEIIAKVEAAVRQTDRLARLVNMLLDVSRIAMGQLHLEITNVSLVDLVNEALVELSGILDKAGCGIQLQINAPVSGFWDRARIEEIITNLLTNAAKFAPGKPVEIVVGEHDGHALLSVRDHGMGISDEDQKRIFDRFERAVSARHFGGLGLGLYISKQIAEAHGGTIDVSSQPGQGAEFLVELPLHAPHSVS